MCGRFVAATDPDGIMRLFVVDERKDEPLPPSWNVAPTMPVRAVAEHAGRRLLVTFRWGLVPTWASDPRIGSRLINARAETAATKPAFREALARRRCLVPADAFYEWGPAEDGRRRPHVVAARDGRPLAFAGLWCAWRDPVRPDAPPLRTVAILTTAANRTLAPLHERMPVVLPPACWDRWLDRDERNTAAVGDLLRPAPDDLLCARPIGDAVNNVRNDHPGLLAEPRR